VTLTSQIEVIREPKVEAVEDNYNAIDSIEDEIQSDRIENGLSESSIDEIKYIRSGLTVHQVEKALIIETLKSCRENRTQAAKLLGISVRTLRNKLAEYRMGE
jgi:DNA-binding protein Fis